MLYRNANCRRISVPEKSAGRGGKGFEALMPATAARSRALAPDERAITSFETVPLRTIASWMFARPRLIPSRALSGITAYQLRRTAERIWIR